MARVAFVTGGTRGIGAGIAKRLQKEGYKVAVCDVVDEQIAKFKEETGIPSYNINVADFDSVAAGVKQVEADVGPIDVLVNNAGITRDARFVKMTREKNWDPVIAVNLSSVFNTCNVLLPGHTATTGSDEQERARHEISVRLGRAPSNFTPRRMRADNVVPLALFLAQQDASGVTGRWLSAMAYNEEHGLGGFETWGYKVDIEAAVRQGAL